MSSLANYPISGISSMIRALDLLSPCGSLLESAIVNGRYPIDFSLLRPSKVRPPEEVALTVGDVVLFRVRDALGAYSDMETLWGARVALQTGHTYLGVLCERMSSKLIVAEFDDGFEQEELDLQLVAQAGGIGYATGFSPTLQRENGCGVPTDVDVVGVLMHPTLRNAPLNVIHHGSLVEAAIPVRRVLPTIICIGTATDVGKTTVMEALVKCASHKHVCHAMKAAGTGWYEDTLRHVQAGAALGTNFTMAGLPTTYKLVPDLYLLRLRQLVRATCVSRSTLPVLLPPTSRTDFSLEPDLLFVEHGGDLIEAGIPDYLSDPELMEGAIAVVVCSESALALRGALAELRPLLKRAGVSPPIVANMPLINPQGFMRRMADRLADGTLFGVLDVNRPELPPGRMRRTSYAADYSNLWTVDELMTRLAPSIGAAPFAPDHQKRATVL